MTRFVATSAANTGQIAKIAPFTSRGYRERSRRWVVVGISVGGLAGLCNVLSPSITRVHAEPSLGRPIENRQPFVRSSSFSVGTGGAFGQTPFNGRAIATDDKRIGVESSAVELLESGIEQSWLRINSKSRRLCGVGMQLVDGEYCSTVVHRCLEPYEDGSGRCRRYAPVSQCFPPLVKMRFCIDRFEYPNRAGVKPTIMVDYTEAMSTCSKERKRLCSAREWTLACEGPDRFPYPHGYVRDSRACNIDKEHRFPDLEALANVETRERELRRIDQRLESGALADCVSAYGVYDLTGNVDEWVTPDGPEESAGSNSRAALKGGYYGIVRARCRPSTTSHAPTFKFYQVGFRCCSDPTVDPSAEDVELGKPESSAVTRRTILGATADAD